ncbi:hypothetical protein P153DRAFT_403977 [Dothidotthia symphoricarpi CBS 119687]|uniref:Uncharacterized protein n=1 Tax=Dothidotthia symphoricarpi CBS 119687 TaxID=1392245 RepID=A0A6A6AD54_9PLEO|nr:uncharacterized protein P153DRAFT_403977 [Dothidotthia symphoricarpi CBS 119687]KAF2129055.1 hypothetical protein P153DRAFT_403977 [Dothidotthia symphoricarpi CBS 119687]
MVGHLQPLPDAPPEIDPDVLLRISALFDRPLSVETDISSHSACAHDTHARADTPTDTTAQPSSADKMLSSSIDVMTEPKLENPSSLEPDLEIEEGIYYAQDRVQIQPEFHKTQVIARYIYPSERRPTQTNQRIPLPKQASFLTRAFHWISSSFPFVRLTRKPIILHLNEAIRNLGRGSPHTQKEKVVGVFLFPQAFTGSTDLNTVPMELAAKPRRIREIIRDEGSVVLVEDIYDDAIQQALRNLRDNA